VTNHTRPVHGRDFRTPFLPWTARHECNCSDHAVVQHRWKQHFRRHSGLKLSAGTNNRRVVLYIPTTTATGTHLAILQPLLPGFVVGCEFSSHLFCSIGHQHCGADSLVCSRELMLILALVLLLVVKRHDVVADGWRNTLRHLSAQAKLDGYGAECNGQGHGHGHSCVASRSVNAVQTYTSGSGWSFSALISER
jgi:hypothetical protein